MKERPRLGVLLEAIRRRKRFHRKALSEASTVSDTYIKQIEDGYDPRTGKLTEPSPKVLRLLADALSDGDGDQALGIYADLATAAGYIPEGLVHEASAAYQSRDEFDTALRTVLDDPRLRPEIRSTIETLVEESLRITRGPADENG